MGGVSTVNALLGCVSYWLQAAFNSSAACMVQRVQHVQPLAKIAQQALCWHALHSDMNGTHASCTHVTGAQGLKAATWGGLKKLNGLVRGAVDVV